MPTPSHYLEQRQAFSQSLIWQLQRDYYSSLGINAWREGEVPHYITSNPIVGKTYAELVLAFLRDLALRGQTTETVYLLELGAGHGRLCYHFFKHFEKYYEGSTISLPPFCYVLSDFAESNLTFWREHSRLRPYLDKGWLDIALFDVENSSELKLETASITLQSESLSQPIIVIANYLFDTVPMELFHIEKQKIERCLLTISSKPKHSKLGIAEQIASLEIKYDYQATTSPIYSDEPLFNALLENYRQQLSSTHLLFPDKALRCLARLRQLSQQGLVLLSADKGHHLLSSIDNLHAPNLVTHGSFSFTVNYHAFAQFCLMQGGLSLFPSHRHASLALGCLLFLSDASSYKETIHSYQRYVDDYGPDEYFSLKQMIEQQITGLTIRDIMAILKLSAYDAQLFSSLLPQLYEILPDINDNERWNIYHSVVRVWDTYFPLGESYDLAFEIGCILLELEFYEEAIRYFTFSNDIYGQFSNSLYNMALCYRYLGNNSQTDELLLSVLQLDPSHEKALKLQATK